MKTIRVLGIVTALALFAVAQNSNAAVQGPLWQCGLEFEAEGGGLQILVGHYKLSGEGSINCADVHGNTQSLPVKVTLGGSPFALRVAAGQFKLAGVASGIGVAHGPQSLLGEYRVVGGTVAVGVGASVQAGLHGGNEALTVNATLAGVAGAGFQVGLSGITIERK